MNFIYGFFLCLFFGIIGAGQVLGFLGVYQTQTAVYLSLLLFFLAAYLFGREHPGHYDLLTGWKKRLQDLRNITALEISFYIASIFIFVLLIAVPLLRWPFSPIGISLTWDAGAYHFPKAVELFRSGSVWDLSVAYGEYPFGYESLLSFCLSLTGDASLFGLVHLAICTFFCLTVWKLACRYIDLPAGLLLFFSVCLMAGGTLLGGERTWLLSGYGLTIGKNDFLLGSASLAVILHSPVGSRKNQQENQLFSFAMASMIALAVKPNAAVIVGPMALLILWTEWNKRRNDHTTFPWLQYVLACLVAVPGILWTIRNLVVLGAVVTPASSQLTAESIASNLANPYLYSWDFPFLILAATAAIVLASIIAVRFIPDLSLSAVAVLCLLFIAFTITPATAFHRQLDVPSHIAWRFGVALMTFTALIILMALQAPLRRCLEFVQQKSWLNMAAIGLLSLLIIAMVWRGKWILQYEPQNEWVLHDQFSSPVGIDGYYSAYDYVQREIHDSVIHVENGLAYYLYGPDFSNTPTKLQYPLEMEDRVPQPVPQYFVIFRPEWQSENPDSGTFAASLESGDWLKKWQLIYDDGNGRVYQVQK